MWLGICDGHDSVCYVWAAAAHADSLWWEWFWWSKRLWLLVQQVITLVEFAGWAEAVMNAATTSVTDCGWDEQGSVKNCSRYSISSTNGVRGLMSSGTPSSWTHSRVCSRLQMWPASLASSVFVAQSEWQTAYEWKVGVDLDRAITIRLKWIEHAIKLKWWGCICNWIRPLTMSLQYPSCHYPHAYLLILTTDR